MKTPKPESKPTKPESKPAKPSKPAARGSDRLAATPDPDEDFVGADDPAAELLDEAVKKTPWWAMSLAFHGLVIAAFPLIAVGHKLVTEAQTATQHITIKPAQMKIQMPDDTDYKRSVAGSPGVVETNPAIDNTPSIQDPSFELSDHNETANNDDHGQALGQSLQGVSSFEGTDLGFVGRAKSGNGTNISMGVGGGSSGAGLKHGGAFGGRFNRRKAGGLGTKTDSAVEFGLKWLARHQGPDGGWSTTDFHAVCGKKCSGEGYPEFSTGATGLALLAFLGAGYTPQNRAVYLDPLTNKTMSYGVVVRNGVKWLLDHQDKDGCLGPRSGDWMYNHAIAALALTEAFGLTNAVAYKTPAQRSIEFLEASRNDYLAWRYTAKCGQNDTSVTGWCVMALKSAQISGLVVSRSAFEGARAWLDRVTESSGQVGYDRLASGEIYVPGKNDKWAHHPSMTAVGVLCRIFIDKKKDANLEKGGKILMQDLPTWEPNAARPTIDFYYWYYATLALFQLEGPNGANWVKWNKRIADVLCGSQHTKKDGCLDGSWDSKGVDRWGYAGGRVYGTAINVLTLEASYRYEAVFGGAARSEAPAKK